MSQAGPGGKKALCLKSAGLCSYRSTGSLPGAVPPEAAAATDPGMHFML